MVDVTLRICVPGQPVFVRLSAGHYAKVQSKK